MKSKPLTIAIVILAAAIILIVSSKKTRDAESTSPDPQSQTEQATQEKTQEREARSAARKNSAVASQEWEEKIDVLLEDDTIPNEQAAEKLLEITLDASAPLPARLDALEHGLNLIEDEDFNNLIGNAMDQGKNELPADLMQAILDDTYNRSNIIQVTTALKVIQGQHSEIKEEAIELLEFQTEQEHGEDINAWQKAVADFIKQQNDLANEDIQEEGIQNEVLVGDVDSEQ